MAGRVADPDQVFLPGSGSTYQISLDPDPVFKFFGIRFQAPDPGAKKVPKGL